jgi:hypothetical protein
MKKPLIGILLGAIAGVVDVIPMIMMNLTWDANLSAFSMWVIVGFLISVVEIKVLPIFKGILMAFLVLFPSAILIGSKEPQSLIPIFAMTTILGGLLGFMVHRFTNKKIQKS